MSCRCVINNAPLQMIGMNLAVSQTPVPAHEFLEESGVPEHHEGFIRPAHQPVSERRDSFLELIGRFMRLKQLSLRVVWLVNLVVPPHVTR